MGRRIRPPATGTNEPAPEDDRTVVRVVRPRGRDAAAPGTQAELDVRAFPMDPADSGLGLEAVTVPGPLGEYPAWSVGRRTDVGDRGPRQPLSCRRAADGADPGRRRRPRRSSSYRNDPGAPEDPSGKLRYGLTEWRDLGRWSLRARPGVDGVVLDGYSMGGGIVMAFLQRSGTR